MQDSTSTIIATDRHLTKIPAKSGNLAIVSSIIPAFIFNKYLNRYHKVIKYTIKLNEMSIVKYGFALSGFPSTRQ
ncbi:hypothetical protein MBAV_004109 [Candidatus Magnetobacterium bavaricum]|uniref:Uncharacterized protein n=1 Tax=Candidatus Magnetobacterium bavaricum TaxID=29290 RepID=A0A0F3GP85_9BACT|nr:hypothetical protein MBAV_004109 [Candidatus Magnetobacterium bavaricum]